MGKVIHFPAEAVPRYGFQPVRATYTVREISQQFGLSERRIRRWTREGLVRAASSEDNGEFRYDYRALQQFRRLRELRAQGMTLRQLEQELRGQLTLFPPAQRELLRLPVKVSPFEEALALQEAGEPEAAECFRKAIQAADCVPDAYCNLGILEYEEGRITKAFDCFTHSLRRDPRHFESHYNLGNLYFEVGNHRLARVHYELAAELEPRFPNIYFNLGLVCALEGDLTAALDVFRKYRELAPEDEADKATELIGRLEQATADLRRAARNRSSGQSHSRRKPKTRP